MRRQPNALAISPSMIDRPSNQSRQSRLFDGSLADPDVVRTIDDLGDRIEMLGSAHERLRETVGIDEQAAAITGLDLFHEYIVIFVVAFLVSLLATPLMRRVAVANGIVDRPAESRKVHRAPVAYLGGVAVFLGILAGVALSYFAPLMPFKVFQHHSDIAMPVPISIVGAMTAIMLIGMIDDIVGISPRVKIGGQLLTAALLAYDDIGVKVAAGLLRPLGAAIGNESMVYGLNLPVPIPMIGDHLQIDVIYWAGTAIIAIFVLGACNASNLIDGLDGLLSGVTAIAMVGLLLIALTMAVGNEGRGDGPLDAARIILTLCVLGACLGFLPHNFNPASIFLGDCGSMLLGFMTIVIILTLGDTGKTHLVIAGLLIYAVPIIDTTLAIIRRKMAGKSISDADDQHLHHQLKRSMGVKGAVLTLYAMGGVFAVLGVGVSLGRGRVVYAIALVVAAFIVVTAIKIAHRARIEQEAARYDQRRAREPAPAAGPESGPKPPAGPGRDKPSPTTV
ncbi:MAG: undecaprenyl/decaprenyl-phosphate alpha-N-acetylglucosaminyl 1-phosphate transferase [Phycisphaerales bacterium]|nr:MAG: undecaprenyl/decaprenyl-phosphate alpha-N-acetylglucosaminyl 1-phosphate transferase [Phycisphaerales bacterium]